VIGLEYQGIVIEAVGSVIGDLVPAEKAIWDGRYSRERARRTGQESIAVAEDRTGPQLAVQAGQQVLARDSGWVSLHLHATIHDPGLDFWSASSYVADQLGLDPAMTLSINAMSNSAVAGLELAASVLSSRADGSRALITAGDTFAMPRFDAWQGDSGIAYGDGGSALLVGRGSGKPGLAELVSTASYADPGLEGLHRGDEDWYSGDTSRPPVRLRQRKAQWLSANAGTDEVDLRNALGVATVTKEALYDAEIDMGDVRWVLCPNYGAALLDRHCLAPLGISHDRTMGHLGRRYGHMGASDQIVALHDLVQRGLVNPGEYVMLLGIGVGMTWTAAVVRCGTRER
jgi:3-oxoacyl-[acyl-carrier-protein] synthase III